MHLAAPYAAAASLRDLAARAGFALPEDEPSGMRLSTYFRILRRLSLALRDETCRLSARPLALGTTDFVLDTLAARDLEGAMHHVARAYNVMHDGRYNRVERRRGRVVYLIDDRDFPHAQAGDSAAVQATMETMLVFLHALLSVAAGVDLGRALRLVRTRRLARHPANGLLAFWTAPVRCRCAAYALEYELSAARLPLRANAAVTPAASVYDMALAMIARREHEEPVTGFPARVGHAMAEGAREQTAVARRLGVSAATLRRRLAEHAVSFRELRARMLHDAARALLAEGRSAADAAEALGFADVRSFSRAFNRWNGATPAAFAAALRRPGPRVREAHGRVSEIVLPD